MPRFLFLLGTGVPVAGFVYALLASRIVPYDARPGAPVGQILGVVASVLVLAALLYLPAKRTDALQAPNRRLVLAHVLVGAGALGVALAHSRLVVNQLPILVLLALLGLYGTGLYGRLLASRRMGPTFGRGGQPFRPAPALPDSFRRIIDRKRELLARIEPAASEATFTLLLSHWTRRPMLAVRYYGLSLEERRQMRALEAASYQSQMGALERWWRVGHLVLAWLVILGLLAHVITTLFFAEFAAGGREIYWWHLRK